MHQEAHLRFSKKDLSIGASLLLLFCVISVAVGDIVNMAISFPTYISDMTI